MRHVICFLVALFIIGMTAWAGATPVSVPGISHLSSGDRMTGMEVTVSLSSDGTSFADYTAVWGDLGTGSWGASGTGWSLSLPESIDTMNLDGYWTLSVDTGYYISSVLISGLPGNTVFDVFPQPGGVDTSLTFANLPSDIPEVTLDGETVPDINDSPGSKEGLVFDYESSFGFLTSSENLWNTDGKPTVSFQYLNPVKLDSENALLWDLYEDLHIFFNDPYFVGGENPFYFYADTDHVVPEPGTLALLGLGLLVLIGVRRKVRRPKSIAPPR